MCSFGDERATGNSKLQSGGQNTYDDTNPQIEHRARSMRASLLLLALAAALADGSSSATAAAADDGGDDACARRSSQASARKCRRAGERCSYDKASGRCYSDDQHASSGRLGVSNFDLGRWEATDGEGASGAAAAAAAAAAENERGGDLEEEVRHVSSGRLGATNFDARRWSAWATSDGNETTSGGAAANDTAVDDGGNSTATNATDGIQWESCNGEANCPPCHDTNTCCMLDNYLIYGGGGNSLGCTSSSLDFLAVTGFQVDDAGAYSCNCGGAGCVDASGNPVDCPACDDPVVVGLPADCGGLPNGTVFGACRGIDDLVRVSFTVNIHVGATQYDVGLYIATDGGEGEKGTATCCVWSTFVRARRVHSLIPSPSRPPNTFHVLHSQL